LAVRATPRPKNARAPRLSPVSPGKDDGELCEWQPARYSRSGDPDGGVCVWWPEAQRDCRFAPGAADDRGADRRRGRPSPHWPFISDGPKHPAPITTMSLILRPVRVPEGRSLGQCVEAAVRSKIGQRYRQAAGGAGWVGSWGVFGAWITVGLSD
jgi:hypothetical protein